jgi:hypothetical protein
MAAIQLLGDDATPLRSCRPDRWAHPVPHVHRLWEMQLFSRHAARLLRTRYTDAAARR